jgi:microcystin-dependent protein
MSICSNCYNGCTEIVSDKCVRYTGIDVPVLGIKTGDSLSYVEQCIITFLTSTLDGTGIKLTIDPEIICEVVDQYLPDCEDLNALNLFTALIKAACDLQAQIDVIVAQLAVLEGNYDIDCLTGVVASSGTHNILQAVITKLCDVDAALVALAVDVDTNYVKLADLDALIQAYLNSIAPIAQQYVKMVPYTAVEYYGTLSNFDAAGAGIAALGWDKIYLCNGQPGTPDKRGRVGVGVVSGVPGGPLNPAVDPAFGNPLYPLNSAVGTNNVLLTTNQMPVHTHTTTPIPVAHTHFMYNPDINITGTPQITTAPYATRARANASQDLNYEIMGSSTLPTLGTTSSTSISANVTVNNAGGGLSHPNFQPAWATNYIIYIP